MNIQTAVLCDAATDNNGKLNLLGTFDTIFTAQMPAIHPQCAVALRIVFNSGEEGRHRLNLKFVDADGKPVMPGLDLNVDVALPEDAHFVSRNFIVTFQQLKFDKPGLFAIDITVDGESLASIPLVVKQAQPPTPALPPS